MHYILLSVLCSVTVSVLLKLARWFDVDINQAIVVNYLVAAGATALWLNPHPQVLLQSQAHAAWPVLLALGVLLPSIFVAMAMSVRHLGVVRTDAAQRLSLVLPLLAAFTIFGEALTWQKGSGVMLGLVAIGCLVARRESGRSGTRKHPTAWLWLLAVFVGLGIIDILFKRIAQLVNVPFASVLLAVFLLAFLLSAFAIGVLYANGRARPGLRHLGGGVLLGLFNFGNILFYIEAHRALPQDPALVFSAMNIGVIVVAALVGVGLFRERLNRWNQLGVGLAVAAVVVLT